MSLFDEVDVVIDKTYVQYFECQKTPGCRFRCKNKNKLTRHEGTCTNVTQTKYVQKCYGNQKNVRTELIDIGVIDQKDNSHRRFTSFDIESVNNTETSSIFGKTVLCGSQKVISIGYVANFGGYRKVLFRNDMTRESGLNLVRLFLKEMSDLQLRHYELIPSSLKDIMADYKIILKNPALSVVERATISRRLYYLRSLCKLKIIGFNSASYDLPCLIQMIIECAGPQNVKVIKKGNSIFDMNVNMLSFRDAMNYSGPISLSRFAAIFKLNISKKIFPYEKFEDIQSIKNQLQWPSYGSFQSSLPHKPANYVNELNTILLDESYQIPCVESLFKMFGFPHLTFGNILLQSKCLPNLTSEQQSEINKFFNISPVNYLTQKHDYEELIRSGQYSSFIDYLYEYNILDCDLLTRAMDKFIDLFDSCFNVSLLDKLSLPGISEEIMWAFYDESCPKMFSFSEDYGFLNESIRSKLQGGPTICFHRHCEIKNKGRYHSSVYTVPNGDRYKRLVSYDFNALYAYSMMKDLPTGLPFYFRKQRDDTFKFEIAGAKSGWSMEAMDWLNFISYDDRFKTPNGEFYPMVSAITGECSITINNSKYSIDGMVKTPDKIYFLEYFGCRLLAEQTWQCLIVNNKHSIKNESFFCSLNHF